MAIHVKSDHTHTYVIYSCAEHLLRIEKGRLSKWQYFAPGEWAVMVMSAWRSRWYYLGAVIIVTFVCIGSCSAGNHLIYLWSQIASLWGVFLINTHAYIQQS